MNKKTTLSLLAIATISGLALAGGLQKKGPSTQTLKHAMSKGAPPANLGDKDADKNAKAIRPVKKGGAKAKGAMMYSTLHVDNETDYNIDIYLDGVYLGRIGGYGDTYDTIPSGGHSFFARSAGGTATWGPVDCYAPDGGSLTEHLN